MLRDIFRLQKQRKDTLDRTISVLQEAVGARSLPARVLVQVYKWGRD